MHALCVQNQFRLTSAMNICGGSGSTVSGKRGGKVGYCNDYTLTHTNT